jgi:lysophospholipase L1-like esterase
VTTAEARQRHLVRFGLAGPYGGDLATEGGDEVAASLHGVDLATYRAIQASFAENAERAARALLAEPEFERRVDEIPWEPDSVVLAIGDSITADRESWANVLGRCMALRRGADRLRLANAAVDGATSTDVLARLDSLTSSGARYALILIGTNDAQAHGRDKVPLVSDAETLRNVDQILRTLDEAGIEARLMAPPPACIDQVSSHWFLSTLPIEWHHLDAKRSVLREHEACVFDCAAAIGEPADERLLIDGLHPNLDGQTAIVRGLVTALTKAASGARITWS